MKVGTWRNERSDRPVRPARTAAARNGCRGHFPSLPLWPTILTLLYIFVYFADYFFVSRSFLAATVHLVLFLMVVRLFSLQRSRDHYMLAVLSFLMVLGAAVLTVDSVFLFSFAGFLLVGVIAFVLMEMRHSLAEEQARAQEPHIASPYGRMAYVLAATAPLLVLLIMAGSVLIFFLLPRVSSRYLSAYAPTNDLSTGFTDRVQLGRIGKIQQSSAVVMHIEIQNDLQGAYDLKWRGVALNRFDGKMWSNAFAPNLMRPGLDGRYRLAPAADEGASQVVPGRKIRYRVLMEPLGANVFFLLRGRPFSVETTARRIPTPEVRSTISTPAIPLIGTTPSLNSSCPMKKNSVWLPIRFLAAWTNT